MINLHAAIHQAVSADTSRLKLFERSSIRYGADWQHKMRYEFDDGTKVELSARYNDQVVFPASPGFELMTIERKGDRLPAVSDMARHVSVEPILAWTLYYEHGESWVEAVTSSGCSSPSWTRTFMAVRLPNGDVQWHVPFDSAACSVISEKFGPDRHRDGPVMFDDMTAWLGLVRQVWEVQIEEEKKVAEVRCVHCGAAKRHGCDDPIPF